MRPHLATQEKVRASERREALLKDVAVSAAQAEGVDVLRGTEGQEDQK